jgi:putative molybdopterin biosynthesis protein
MKRNIYLSKKSLAEARKILLENFDWSAGRGREIVAVPDTVGRVLAEAVFARLSSPHFHAAAMDGIAVAAEDTFGSSEAAPKTFTVGENAFYVNTGHVMPAGTNAVIMIENVNALDDRRVEIENPAFPWQYVRKVGEDIVATELLFPRNHVVTPYCIGALLAGGLFEVAVRTRPRVLIIPTGSELVDWRDVNAKNLPPGAVVETNSFVLGKLVETYGGIFERHPKIEDDVDKIARAVEQAVKAAFDLVLIVGGSSAGSKDYSRHVIDQLGDVLVHGVTIMPGKPVVIGRVNGKPVFGIPGYPVSAIIAFEQFVGRAISQILEQPERQRPTIMVRPTKKIASKLGVEEFIRVKLGTVGEHVVATSLPRGAGSITSFTEADGIIRIPANLEGLNEHEPVRAELLKPVQAIEKTIVVVGSHDNTLDQLADHVKAAYPDLALSSSHVGSMGGLMAIKKGVCHLAGSHLLDTQDGSYNLSYIKRFLPNVGVKVVNLVLRDQGLILARGNPKGIAGIDDLQREDVTFVNRQGGSGTRILLDYKLRTMQIDPGRINGYGFEEFTHMAVAVSVLSGTADVGLGIYAAAKALNLDFIPVITEQYDLIIPETHFNSSNIQRLLEIINNKEFQQRVEALGGYSTARTGEIRTG